MPIKDSNRVKFDDKKSDLRGGKARTFEVGGFTVHVLASEIDETDPEIGKSLERALRILSENGITPLNKKIKLQYAVAGNLVASFHESGQADLCKVPLDYGKRGRDHGPEQEGWAVIT